jgi:predicted Rossmann-fold nucleotide-binding protein
MRRPGARIILGDAAPWIGSLNGRSSEVTVAARKARARGRSGAKARAAAQRPVRSEAAARAGGTVPEIRLTPEGTCLESLSPSEIEALFEKSRERIHALLRRCALAVLNSGQEDDDVKEMLRKYADFTLEVIKTPGGIELLMRNVPGAAFVSYEYPGRGGTEVVHKVVEGIRQNVFAILRDLIFVASEIERTGKFDLSTPEGITDAVFLILRNAGVFNKTGHHKVIVCWGGHAIGRVEYEYTQAVGYECGLRLMDIITGCGPGAMKGPMKGATIAHSKQRIKDGRYIGISEPGIIASEAPNPIVDPLVIMPDIEKRLEAFVRLGHGIVIFPGGAGTAEELMYILGVLMHPNNRRLPFPLILTGPESSRDYFEELDAFVRDTLGKKAAGRYQVIVEDPRRVALEMNRGLLKVKAHREKSDDSYYFNRNLFIPPVFQRPFEPSHEAVEKLRIRPADDPHQYAATLRRVFSSVVWGNVKPEGVQAVEEKGPLSIHGDREIMSRIDGLLAAFVKQGRMRLTGEYRPVYRIRRRTER